VDDIEANLHEAGLALRAARRWADERLRDGMPPVPLAIAMVSVGIGVGLAQDGPYVWARLLRGLADTLEQGGSVTRGLNQDGCLSNH
jgi:hypothetical protein